MRVFSKIRNWWKGLLEKRELGFTQQQLGQLYVELVSRDDFDWREIDRNGYRVRVKNTAFGVGDLILSVVGDYDTGAFKKLFIYNNASQSWDEVLCAGRWKAAKRGPWEEIVRKMVNRRAA